MTPADARRDADLVADALEDDGDAVEALCRRYRSRLVAHCARRTGDLDLAEDLAHETLLRAIANLRTFDTARPLWPWLARIASNLAVDRMRHLSRQILDADAADLEREPIHELSLAEALSDREEVAAALRALPPRQRAALELSYLQDWDTRAVASWFSVSPSAVKQLLFRARHSLREAMAPATSAGASESSPTSSPSTAYGCSACALA